ncbi:MAG: phosphatase PAP2 family protein [Clostridia bacterium]|nr:phosphatase PAP2 family protein [Clostridia bacterium]
MRKSTQLFLLPLGLLTAFILWTAALFHVDVQPIGPQGSSVGFAAMNGPVHRLTGVNMTLYTITDWLGLVPVFICMGFAVLGLVQWIGRKSIRRVDGSILVLGGFYLLVIFCYLFFEGFVVNRRPVLISGVLEASYPSSTTLLVLCVIPTTLMQLRGRVRRQGLRTLLACLLTAFVAFMVVGRLLSGVHWFSDIIGGVLLSAALVTLYRAALRLLPHAP